MRSFDKCILAGDWHGNSHWACSVVYRSMDLLRGQDFKVIVQLGDFGIWSGAFGDRFLRDLTQALDETDQYVWFLDGNHENFPLLERLTDDFDARASDVPEHAPAQDKKPDQALWVTHRIAYMPRGTTFILNGKKWVIAGGAVSVDRCTRTEGESWWPQEELTDEQVAQIMVDNDYADVLLCHDRPADVFLPSLKNPANWPDCWDRYDLYRSENHRHRIQVLFEHLKPELMAHGHYHEAEYRPYTFKNGKECFVLALNKDDENHNTMLLDTQTLEFTAP